MNIKIYNKSKIKINDLKNKIFQFFNYILDYKNMNIIFLENKEIQKINFYYRQKNYPTDVLTFVNELEEDDSLGDVFISLVQAFKQAKKYNYSFIKEVCFLSLHGYLHLKGYEDHTEKDSYKMIYMQKKILNKYNSFLNF
ncbi:rRNA maturation RNase YbeY [Candidatus Phytoplasma oryzae]|nr:rRNA maturation RNase YbeY [Candidatus Phytoplasma oryzae]